MHNVWLVALREFKATAMTKAFVFGVIVLPVAFYVILGVAFAAGLFDQKSEPIVGTIVIVDATEDEKVVASLEGRFSEEEQLRRRERQRAAMEEAAEEMVGEQGAAAMQNNPALESAFSQPLADVDFESLPEDVDLEAQKQRVRDGEVLALIQITENTVEPPVRASDGASPEEVEAAREEGVNRYDIYFPQNLKAQFRDEIRDATDNAILDVRYSNAGVDRDFARRLAQRPASRSRSVTETGEAASDDFLLRIIPIAFMMLLFIAVFTGAQYLMMSTIEEKSSRVMEVLLSAVSPMQLMTGKIVGQGFVGIIVMILYGGAGLGALIVFGRGMGLLSASMIAWQVFYFILAYFSIAAIMAAVGAAVTEIKEAQALQGPLIGGLILVFYFCIFLGISNPHSPVTQVLSFVPPFTPLVMSMRVGQIGDPVPMWQMVGTTIVGVLGTFFLVWAAAKIFRVGVLMYGKPPSLPGLIKWMRYS